MQNPNILFTFVETKTVIDMRHFEINGTYGSGNTPCIVFVVEDGFGYWYCVEGSRNANFTHTDLYNTEDQIVNVETLEDADTFSVDEKIETLEDFYDHVNDLLY